MNKTALILIFVLIVLKLQAQSDFQPGYYITNDDKTVKGLIDYRGDIRSSKVCVFKENFSSKEIRFEPKDIKAYRFDGGKFYITKEITKEKEEPKLIFVEYMVNGIVSLYYYFDSEDHYLIEINGKLVELTNNEEKVYIEDKGEFIKNSNKYIGVLKAAMSNSQEILPQIDNTEFSRKSLIKVVKNYHDYVCDGTKCIIYEKNLPPVKLSCAPIIGTSLSKLEFGEDKLYGILSSKNSYSLSFGFLTNISPIVNKKLSIDLGVNLVKNYYFCYGKEEDVMFNSQSFYDLHIHTVMVQPNLGLKYTFPKGKIRPALEIGTTLNYFIKKNSKLIKENSANGIVNTFESEINPLANMHWGGFIQLGCDFKLSDRLIGFTNMKYHYSSKVSSESSGTIQTSSLNFGVYF